MRGRSVWMLAGWLLACDDDPGSAFDGGSDRDAAVDSDAGVDASLPECVTSPAAEVAACADVIGTAFDCEGRRHVADESEATWEHNPPHSGAHLSQWETVRGEHDEPIARGNWVHNLEHGWVMLLHRCPGGCDAELAVLRDVVAQRPEARILMTPDELLDAPRFAAVSWTWVFETDAPDLATLLCFVDQHEGQAPEDVP